MDYLARAFLLHLKRLIQSAPDTHSQKRLIAYQMKEYIEAKLALAKERIHIGGTTLEEIAFQCGFATYSHFNRSFRLEIRAIPKSIQRASSEKITSPILRIGMFEG
jgi:AraC-like DNA-binding protein